MKKIHLYIITGLFGILANSCLSPDYVSPTVTRQGITSLTAYFTSGTNEDVAAATYTIPDASTTDNYVIPIPYYYPASSDSTTEAYMTAMKVVAIIANNCKISPAINVLDLTQKSSFTFTSPDGTSRTITISGERVHSSSCAIKSFILTDEGVTGVIDEDSKTISLISTDDLSSCTADVTLSPHATISPDPTAVHDYNSDVQFTVTADDGTTTATYTITKNLPNKIANGIRSNSANSLFSVDLTTLGVTNADNIHPTLAVIGKYLVVNYGDGSTPIYLKKATGDKVGSITLGSANATGSVTSDLNGNMLICNYATNGSTLNFYKTNSVTAAPSLYLSYNNETGFSMGSRIHIQGDLSSNAIIVATCDGPSSQYFVRWIVTDGVIGSPNIVQAGTSSQWNGFDGNAKVVSRTTDVSNGYFLGYYDGGNDNIYYFNNSNVTTANLTGQSNGSGWGYNNSCLDVRTFNNIQYLALYAIGYWPDWGLPATAYLYNVSSLSNFSDAVDTSPALYYSTTETAYTSIGYASDGRTGDVLLFPTTDGYKLDLFYIDNTSLGVGCIEFDCIDK